MLYDKRWDSKKNAKKDDAEVFSRAIDLLKERGWCKGTSMDARGRMCVGGALAVAIYGHVSGWGQPAWVDAVKICSQLLPVGAAFPSWWNNAEERTLEEVIDLLSRARKIAESA